MVHGGVIVSDVNLLFLLADIYSGQAWRALWRAERVRLTPRAASELMLSLSNVAYTF